jgi:hypothetical protein
MTGRSVDISLRRFARLRSRRLPSILLLIATMPNIVPYGCPAHRRLTSISAPATGPPSSTTAAAWYSEPSTTTSDHDTTTTSTIRNRGRTPPSLPLTTTQPSRPYQAHDRSSGMGKTHPRHRCIHFALSSVAAYDAPKTTWCCIQTPTPLWLLTAPVALYV